MFFREELEDRIMKKRIGLVIAAAALLMLSGCGSAVVTYGEPEMTYYLQSYDDRTGEYEGVADVYYECGRDIVGYTEPSGAFSFDMGDACTFYDLDDTVSYEYDRLYISRTVSGRIAVGEYDYACDSGWHGVADRNGKFIFDPDYAGGDGDICTLEL